jgi:hypothetical protein
VFLRRGVWSHQPLPPQRAKSRGFAGRVREDGTSERRGSPGFFIRGQKHAKILSDSDLAPLHMLDGRTITA